MRPLIPCIWLFVLSGCGTAQYSVPPRPLESGEIETRVAVGFSTSRFAIVNLQVSGFVGVGDRDAVGWCLSNFILPFSISYAHYWELDDDFAAFQFHAGNLFDLNYNALLEADVAASLGEENNYHTLKLGVGYYAASPLRRAKSGRGRNTALLPVIGYQWHGDQIVFNADLAYGMSRHYVRFYKGDATAAELNEAPHVYTHGEIVAIQRSGGRDDLPISVELTDGSTVVIAARDPFGDCVGCGFQQRNRAAYRASSDTRLVWVWKEAPRELHPVGLTLVELDLARVLSDYDAGGDLVLVQDGDVLEKTLRRVKSGRDDISFSLGWWTQSEDE